MNATVPEGVSAEAWAAIGATRNGTAWHIPELDADGNTIGTAIRPDKGRKHMVSGSKRGLTIAWPPRADAGNSEADPILIVEGQTDAAVGWMLNFTAIGRPSATGGVEHLRPLVYGKWVLICAENDSGAGIDGARRIADQLHDAAHQIKIITPPRGVKDLREWNSGPVKPTRQEVLAAMAAVDVYEPEPEPDNRRRLAMRNGSDIDDEPAKHLWRRRFCRGINVLFSRPGWGKTTMACRIVGHVTAGKPFPDGAPCEQGTALYLKGEGSDASLRDRMQQAGADPARYILVSRAEGQGEAMIDLALDVPLIAEALERHPDIRLIVIDTLDSMFPSMRMIDNANIRRCLWPLQQLAEERDVCTLILAHTNKGQYSDPMDRLSGGRAIGGAARSVWCLGKLDHDGDEHFLASVKVNDFAPAPSLSYEIVALDPARPGAIRWGEEREDVTAWELDRPNQAGSSSKAEDCQVWLADLLRSAGPLEPSDLLHRAGQAGYGRKVLAKARNALGAETRHAKGVFPVKHYVCLPDQDPPNHTPTPMTPEGGAIG